MSNFLTTTEINDLKAIRATYIVDADLTELRTFFAKYGIGFSLDKGINTERTFKMITDNFDSSRNLNGLNDAKVLKLYTIAKTMDLTGAIKAITDKAFLYQHEYCFDATNFILDNNFAFTTYLEVNNDSSQVARIKAVNVSMGTPRV